ncbi:hypothetical protein DIPPA_15993 [Diplonema papillatum]|nr:hypothetical protein DIPPA_15993 [Diplonema papillatum]|eukprot:gene22737-34820_t
MLRQTVRLLARPTPDFVMLYCSGPLELEKIEAIAAYAREARPNALVMGGGLLGKGRSLADGGQAMVRALNAAGFTHAALGPGDLFLDKARLAQRVHEFKGTVLSSNVSVRGVIPLSVRVADTICSLTGFVTCTSEDYVITDGAAHMRRLLRARKGDFIFPLTCQTEEADEQLARGVIPRDEGSQMPAVLGASQGDVKAVPMGPNQIFLTSCGVAGTHVGRIDVWMRRPASHCTVDVRDISHVVGSSSCSKVADAIGGHLKFLEYEVERFPLFGGSALHKTSLLASAGSLAKGPLRADACVLHKGCLLHTSLNASDVATLKEAIPQAVPLAVITLTGNQLASLLKWTPVYRDKREAELSWQSLVIDSDWKLTAARVLTGRKLANGTMEALDRQRSYRVAVPRVLLLGGWQLPLFEDLRRMQIDFSDHHTTPLVDLVRMAAYDQYVEHQKARQRKHDAAAASA